MSIATIRKAIATGVSLATMGIANGLLTGTPEMVANIVIAVAGTLLTWSVPNAVAPASVAPQPKA